MLLSLLLVVMSSPADAAGYYFLDAGTRGMSRGGAFIAGTDDLSAQYYNPAALMNLDQPQAYINYSMVAQDISFTRKDYDEETGEVTKQWDTENNIAPAMSIPAFGVSHDFGLQRANFALGFWTPFAPSIAYDPQGSQHYTLVDSLVWQLYAGPSAAFQLADWISVGIGVHWTLVRAEERLSLVICNVTIEDDQELCPDDIEPSENDVTVNMEMMDPNRITGNLGILIEPKPWISVGASVLPPLKVEGTGTLSADFSEDHWMGENGINVLDGKSFKDDDIRVLLSMPLIVRAGVAVRPTEKVEVEVATVYQRWQQMKEVRVTDVDLTLAAREGSALKEDVVITDDVVLPADYEDAWSVRVGGDVNATEWLTLRAGGFWEGSAIPVNTQSVALVDGPKWGYGAGGTARVLKRRLGIDLGMSQTFITEREITTSEVSRLEVPISLLDAASEEGLDVSIKNGQKVGNGAFSSQLLFLSAGLVYYFGQPKG